MCDALQAHRDELLDLAVANGGNTRGDAKFDVDGATFTLAAYAEIGQGARRRASCSSTARASRSAAARASTASTCPVPRHGVAVHINAFNFPAWGLAEKAAVRAARRHARSCASPPPARRSSRTGSWRSWSTAKVLPEGALSLLVGGAGDLLEHLGPQDVVAFTGSSDTGAHIRSLRAGDRELGARERGGGQPQRGRPRPRRRGRQRDLRLFRQGRAARHDAEGRPEVHGHPPRPGAGSDGRPALRDDLVERLRAIAWATRPTTACAWARWPPRSSIATCARASTCWPRDGRLVFGGAGPPAVGVPDGKGFFVAPVLIEVEPARPRAGGALARGVRPRGHARPVRGTADAGRGAGGARERRARLLGLLGRRRLHRRQSCSGWRRTTAASSWAARRSPRSRPGPGPSCPSSSTAAPGAPAAARSWAGCAASRSTCSASPSKARGRSSRRSSVRTDCGGRDARRLRRALLALGVLAALARFRPRLAAGVRLRPAGAGVPAHRLARRDARAAGRALVRRRARARSHAEGARDPRALRCARDLLPDRQPGRGPSRHRAHIRAAGHEVGNHHYSLRSTLRTTDPEYLEGLRRTEDALRLEGPTKPSARPAAASAPASSTRPSHGATRVRWVPRIPSTARIRRPPTSDGW